MKFGRPVTRVSLCTFAALMVSGCISLPKSSTQDDPPADVYTLKSATAAASSVKPGGAIIVVEKPEVPTGFDTERIALYFEQGHRLDYYAGAAWSGRLDDLLQNFIIQTARGDLPGKIVGTSELTGTARYKLTAKMADFQPVYAAGPDGIPRLDVAMTLTLIALPSGRVVATVNAKKSAQASANRMTVITKELEGLLKAATDQALRSLAPRLTQS